MHSNAYVTEPPENTVLPVISGTAEPGETLSVSTGTWTGDAPITFAYQWLLDGAEIVGETGQTYNVIDTDIGSTISVAVEASNPAGSVVEMSNDVGVVEGVPSLPITIGNAAKLQDGAASFPLTHAFASGADTTGVIVTVKTSGIFPKVICKVDGVEAELVQKAGVLRNYNTSEDCAGFTKFYIATSAETVSVEVDTIPSVAGQKTSVEAMSVKGGPVVGWQNHQWSAPGFSNASSTVVPWLLSYNAGDLITTVSQIGSTDASTLVPAPTNADNGLVASNQGLPHTSWAFECPDDQAGVENSISHSTFRLSRAIFQTVFTSAVNPGLSLDEAAHRDVLPYDLGQAYRTHKVTGRYYGPIPSGVEVSVVETDLTSEAEVLGWTELTGFVAANGRFSGDVQLPFQSAADQYYRIIGRLATGEIDDSGAVFSVGDVFGVYGQSNGHNLSSLKGVAPAASTGGSAHILDSPSAGNQSGPVGGADGLRSFAAGWQAHTGRPCKIINGAVPGASMVQLIPGAANFARFLDIIGTVDGHLSGVFVNHGEQVAATRTLDAAEIAEYADQWDQIRDALVAVTGQAASSVPLMFSQLGRYTDGDSDEHWHNFLNAQNQITAADPTKYLTHPQADLNLGDSIHITAADQGIQGERWAYQAARILGDIASGDPMDFQFNGGTAVDANTTTINVTHGIGTDFTPTTDILGFTVSDDGFATSVTPTAAVRTDAVTITLTHSSLSPSGRSVYYNYGLDPAGGGGANHIRDNSSLAFGINRPWAPIVIT